MAGRGPASSVRRMKGKTTGQCSKQQLNLDNNSNHLTWHCSIEFIIHQPRTSFKHGGQAHVKFGRHQKDIKFVFSVITDSIQTLPQLNVDGECTSPIEAYIPVYY